jgi:hypothetical protein
MGSAARGLVTTLNLSDDVTLEAPNSLANTPVANLQASPLAKRWRCSSEDRTTGIYVEAPITSGWIGAVALVDHDLPQDATWDVAITDYANATAYGAFTSGGDYSITTDAGSASVTGGQLVLTGFKGTVALANTEPGYTINEYDANLQPGAYSAVVKMTISGWTPQPNQAVRFRWYHQATMTLLGTETMITNGTHAFKLSATDNYVPDRWRLEFDALSAFDLVIDDVEIYTCADDPDSLRPGLAIHPPLQPWGSLPWGQFSWDGTVSAIDRALMRVMSYETYDAPYACSADTRVWVFLHGVNSGFDFVSAGRLMVAQYWMPWRPPDLGLSVLWIDKSEITESDGGQTYVQVRPPWREMQIGWSDLTQDEAFSLVYAMQERGSGKDVLIITDPQDDDTQQSLSIYGRLVGQPVVTRTHELGTGEVNDRGGDYSVTIKVREQL